MVFLGLGFLVVLVLLGLVASSRLGWCALMLAGIVLVFALLLAGSVLR